MSRVVVADAGPLIALARIGRLELLQQSYGAVIVPHAVFEEFQLDSGRPGALALGKALTVGWLDVMGVPTEISELNHLLDPGEAEAISLAEAIDCRFLLIDERRGRVVARHRGIPVVGTGGFLVSAKREGLIDSVAAELNRLLENGYRLAPALVEEIRRLAGEQ